MGCMELQIDTMRLRGLAICVDPRPAYLPCRRFD